MDKIEKTVCYNCERAVVPSDRFCSHCGQANHPTKLTISVLFKDFIINFFNVDSKFFKTVKYIYSPSFLTKQYLAGKRKSYANPIRTFIINMFVFFAILAFTLNEKAGINSVDEAKYQLDARVSRSLLYDKYLNYTDTIPLTSTQKTLIDSLQKHVFKGIEESDSSYLDLSNSTFMRVDMKKARFLRKDVIELPPDSLFIKYDITGAWDRIVIKQMLKTITNPSSSIRTLIGNSFWVVVLLIIVGSLLLKLLYVRNRVYLLEHIILQCNIHSLVFILGSIGLILLILSDKFITYQFTLPILFFIIVVYAFKLYYGQGIIKTFIKSIIYSFGYFFMMIFCFLFVVFVSFILM
jgi:hypothetical protein